MPQHRRGESGGEVVERGDIYFVYRPKVRAAESADADTAGPQDVGGFYLVLQPEKGAARPIALGRRRLPDIASHERVWGFVETVARSPREIEAAFQAESYETKTRGERERPAARPAGEGVYAIVRRDGDMRLLWVLELPDSPGDVQASLNIPEEGSLAVSVKNPEAGHEEDETRPSAGAAPEYPDDLREVFRGRRFATEDPRLLDYEGAQIVFTGLRTKVDDADLSPEDESRESADTFAQLRMDRKQRAVAPLFKGDWG